ncbi:MULTISPECIES: HAD family phosphatase [unclassified Ruminococcus]|uniref:HAD family hydrolase n=1 Tax=unclassified Ruminococcus TaxID=2608920 RepID=UPI00210D8505|nr:MULTISPECIES: HAD family phosphatase [unclassified Ruminococcus]MCQ4022198.1 HAD-IA family hydrolase [Ruminococcus sp. zg-924]MCQ4115239.1 HAD-IA family hydrolase [Ruminococcus sp. zg-921]
MRINAVVFDMDGLMLDTEWTTYKLSKENAAKMGYEITLDMFKQTVGKRSPDAKLYYKSVFGDGFDFDRMRQMNLECFRKCIEENGVPKKPGIDKLLTYLKNSGIKCAVASSTSQAVAEDLLKRADIFKYFSAAVFGNMIEHGKPAPDIFIEASSRLNIPCGECMCLEDSHNGIRAGYSAGMVTVMVPDMLPPNDEIIGKAYTVAKDLFEVIEIIDRINNG